MFPWRKVFWLSICYLKSAFLRPHIFLYPVAGATEMLPYGVPFESLIIYIGGWVTTFLISNSLWRIGLFFPQNSLSPVAGATEMLPYGVPFESLSFLYSTPTHFFDFKFLMENRPFFRLRFFITRCWSYWNAPHGFPFESLSFLYSPPTHFFDFKFLMENRPFFRPRFFILTDGWDGWMDGWMGWMVGPLFFCSYLENYLIIIHNFFWNF